MARWSCLPCRDPNGTFTLPTWQQKIRRKHQESIQKILNTMSYISICSNKSPLPCEASSGQLTTSHDQFQRSGPHFSAVAVPLRDACFDEARWNSWLGGGCYDNGDGYGMGMSQILKENLRLFSFFLFLLFFLPYLFEDQSVPWYAIKKRLKKHPELSGRVM